MCDVHPGFVKLNTLTRKQPHISKYLGQTAVHDQATVYLFTELMDGDLESLIGDPSFETGRCFIRHILRALVFLESQTPRALIHRDIKSR